MQGRHYWWSRKTPRKDLINTNTWFSQRDFRFMRRSNIYMLRFWNKKFYNTLLNTVSIARREFLKFIQKRICDYINDNKKIHPESEREVGSKFEKLWFREWDVLKFKEWNELYADIVATVWVWNSIMFQWKKTSLSRSAQLVLKEKFEKHRKAVQWTLFRTYNGKTIREMMDEIDG